MYCRGARATGGVNLYASSPDAFTGRHERVADLFGAWAAGAVSNADLSFATRAEAARAPQRLQEQDSINQAVGIVMASSRVDSDTARGRLREAADRAGVPELQVALAVLHDCRLA